ncbi:hypothetical protein RJ640_028081 [Escallonia rubra]|uniref:Amino acid transporter transmembrane domain-containing protein n=1 Tax=Escallonia rubra TaxID=112253 RepID=A0AA88QSJ2_9ASTE|nr:hypothetical protein RJ640_028081 [Escallonia rubra]
MVAPMSDDQSDSKNVDTRTAKQKAIDEWLPISSSRNAKWWYSAFHNVTAMVGAGVLGLPYAMSELGWGPGVTVMVISWIVTLYTLWQMVEMHEMVPGKRFDRYHELGQHAFGEKLGLYIVVPQQLIVEVGVDIVYMVTGGKSLQKFHQLVRKDPKENIKLSFFIMIFASAHFVLSHLPNFNSIAGVSLAAAVMSLSYSTIAWGACIDKGVQPNVQYGYKATTRAGTVFNFFSALGEVAFAYAGHNVVLEIQATIPSTPEKPSKGPMWRGVIVAYIVVALCYFPVSMIGYWMYGNQVEDNILISLEKPVWLIAMANMFVVVHVIGSYQIYAMPVFDMMETVLVKKLNFKPTRTLRFVTRNLYVAFTMFVGITFPFFSGLLGFFGGFAFAPTTYFVRCFSLFVTPLYHVACHLQTEEVQLILDRQLGMHRSGRHFDDSGTYWSAKADHSPSQDIQILPINRSSTKSSSCHELPKQETSVQDDNRWKMVEWVSSNFRRSPALPHHQIHETELMINSCMPSICRMKGLQSRRRSMIGFQSLPRGMQNGGTLHSTTSLPWLEPESSVFRMPWHLLDDQTSRRGPGVVILVLSWIITLYTLWQMVEMHEMVPGKRFDRYHELGQHAFGEKLGLYIVVPQQLICEVGVNVVYMVTGGKSLQKFQETVCPNCKQIKTTYFIMIFASVHFVLSHLPNFNSISGVSLAAAVMSLTYSTIAWTASVHKGVQPDVDYSFKSTTTSGKVFDFFTSLGDVAFAYAGHNVVLEIQATIPSTPEKPSKGPMWKGVLVAYFVVGLCYFPVALIGYRMFGNKVEDNILISLEKPAWLIAAANMFVVIHVIGSYQIYAMPVFDMLETLLVKKLHFKPSAALRFITRNIYVDLHYSWNSVDDFITYWRAKKYHKASKHLQVLQLIVFLRHEEQE